MFIGSAVPSVSGSKMASTPPARADPPMMMKGHVAELWPFPAKRGAMIPPILPNVEANPTAEPLSSVV